MNRCVKTGLVFREAATERLYTADLFLLDGRFFLRGAPARWVDRRIYEVVEVDGDVPPDAVIDVPRWVFRTRDGSRWSADSDWSAGMEIDVLAISAAFRAWLEQYHHEAAAALAFVPDIKERGAE